MKRQRTLWMLALFAACNVLAQTPRQQTATLASSVATTRSFGNVKLHWLAPAQPTDWRHNRQPVEGLSPQAWTTMVGWHPGRSAFPDDQNVNSSAMPLLWFSLEPQR